MRFPLVLALAFLLLGPQDGAVAADAPAKDTLPKASATDNRLYRQGLRALQAGDWKKAEDYFERYISAAADAERMMREIFPQQSGYTASERQQRVQGGHDAALYWLAYARFKDGRLLEAQRDLERLMTRHPTSAWVREARILALDIDFARGVVPRLDNLDDPELRLYALDGLLRMAPEQGVPAMEAFLAGPYPAALRRQALFVLSQSTVPAALVLLSAQARRTDDRALQLEAIRLLGLRNGQDGIVSLGEIYRATADVEIRKAVIAAWRTAGAARSLVEVFRDERDVVLRQYVLHQFGESGWPANSRPLLELERLYGPHADQRDRKVIVEIFRRRNDAAALMRLRAVETDAALRREIDAALADIAARGAPPTGGGR